MDVVIRFISNCHVFCGKVKFKWHSYNLLTAMVPKFVTLAFNIREANITHESEGLSRRQSCHSSRPLEERVDPRNHSSSSSSTDLSFRKAWWTSSSAWTARFELGLIKLSGSSPLQRFVTALAREFLPFCGYTLIRMILDRGDSPRARVYENKHTFSNLR